MLLLCQRNVNWRKEYQIMPHNVLVIHVNFFTEIRVGGYAIAMLFPQVLTSKSKYVAFDFTSSENSFENVNVQSTSDNIMNSIVLNPF